MKRNLCWQVLGGVVLVAIGAAPVRAAEGQAKAWRGTITIPTYTWEDDVNPTFWALEGTAKLSTTHMGGIIYPYTMQDHLSRTKVDRTYKAVFLENEYLKVTCLPELGGRLHSVFDKTTSQEMFHTNKVIKPGMIAMRGAWISGGVEWNSGPHGHTVTIVSPVDVFEGQNSDGSAFIEIANTEKIFRTRWTVRVTLHPGKAYLDEKISISNPTDGVHPYYFWNCTAFPNKPGTRFIYPMTLGTDHSAREFFTWPIHKGKDLTWLKNYEIYTSVFAYQCVYDFFGAYDVDADRGIVSAANHYKVPGKKAWTWGEWDFGKFAQKNLTDDDGPYIEVQSGPLPTQSDYGLLGPHEEVSWQEYWYAVHGLGEGFEFANENVAIQTSRKDGRLELRLLGTSKFPGATCILTRDGRDVLRRQVDLSPATPQVVTLANAGGGTGVSPVSAESTGKMPVPPVQVTIKGAEGQPLASFVTPLPIPKVSPPDPSKFVEKPDDQCSVEELYYKGRKFYRDTNRLRAREYYGKALAKDPGHVASLRAMAVMDVEAALYQDGVKRLERAVDRDPDDGLSWYFLGVAQLRLKNSREALRCGYRAAHCFGTHEIGYDLAFRALMCMEAFPIDDERRREAILEFARNHAMKWFHPVERPRMFWQSYLPRDVIEGLFFPKLASATDAVTSARPNLGEAEFEILESALALADRGLFREAAEVVSFACVEELPEAEVRPLPLYYLAYFASAQGDAAKAEKYLQRAAKIEKDFVFASRPEEVEILKFAVQKNPGDANAHLHLGNLYANLGRVDEAVQAWEKCAAIAPAKAMALRNLGLFAWAKGDMAKAEGLYRKAAAARPSDQTLFRDLADVLLAADKRPEAIRVMETMPVGKMRRAEITIALTQAYCDERRWDDAVKVLESTPYFVNWEGQDVTWRLFNRAHVERGRQFFDKKDFKSALADFEAALTYPANLNVGRSNRPQEAQAQYWRGRALEALGRTDEARAAWKAGAAGSGGAEGGRRGKGSSGQGEYRELCRKALEGKG